MRFERCLGIGTSGGGWKTLFKSRFELCRRCAFEEGIIFRREALVIDRFTIDWVSPALVDLFVGANEGSEREPIDMLEGTMRVVQ